MNRSASSEVQKIESYTLHAAAVPQKYSPWLPNTLHKALQAKYLSFDCQTANNQHQNKLR